MIKLLDFWAEWCGPCKMMEPVLDEVEKDLAGKLELEKINVDEHPERSMQYGVLSIPTYIVMGEDGKEIDRIVGFTQKDVFLEKLRKHLSVSASASS